MITQNAAEPMKVRETSTRIQYIFVILIQQSWLKEMSSGLFDDNIDHEQMLETHRFDSVSVGKPVRIETKTVQQRNKEKIHKKKEALAKAAKEKRILDNELFR